MFGRPFVVELLRGDQLPNLIDVNWPVPVARGGLSSSSSCSSRPPRPPRGRSRAVQLELPHVLAGRALGARFERHARGHVFRLFLPHDVVHAVRGQRRGGGQQRRLVGHL